MKIPSTLVNIQRHVGGPPLIKVLIVDDHALVRMGIRRLLEDMPDVEVVADAESGEQALALVKLHSPDVRPFRHENARH